VPGGGRSSGSRSMLSVKLTTSWRGVTHRTDRHAGQP
jgi:hypothetical protein